jgi:hypothetical protein
VAEAAVVVLALVVLLVDPQLEEQVVMVFKFQQRSVILQLLHPAVLQLQHLKEVVV